MSNQKVRTMTKKEMTLKRIEIQRIELLRIINVNKSKLTELNLQRDNIIMGE